jgi:leader peptidase (prepilin peptidase) / N-methyltransferase
MRDQARTLPLAAVAAVGALAGGLGAVPLLEPLAIAASAVLAGLMAAIAAEDIRRLRVPDLLNALVALSGLAFAAADLGEDALRNLLWASVQMLLCGGALLFLREAFFRLRGLDGLGLGDVKLAAAAGAWLGVEGFAYAVLLAALGALVFVAVVHRRQGAWARERRIPFAFYLAPAIWACWFTLQLVPRF